MARDDAPEWVSAYLAEEQHGELPPEAIAWMRSRSSAVQALLLRFPPHCVVMLPTAHTARPCYAVVRGYERRGRFLRVALAPGLGAAQWNSVPLAGAAYYGPWRGLTPEKVAGLLAPMPDGGQDSR